MQELKNLQDQIEQELGQLQASNNPTSLYEPIHYFLSIGGKRIRPILVLMAARMFDNPNHSVMNQALAVELFHNFTLIHDDIMDKAPLRRGLPTVHEKWNDSQGILSGDVLLIVAYQYLMKTDAKYYGALFNAFNKMAIEVCEGQQMDMDFEHRNDVQIDDYIEMIRLKTSVLLGCALELGAIVSDASEHDRKHLYDFGVNIGIAFQIQDDLLDVYADASKFGKQVGGDIISNKKTFLYLKAREHANETQRAVFDAQLLNTDFVEKVAVVRGLYDTLRVRDLAEKTMNHYYDVAMQHLNAVQVAEENKGALSALADYLMSREV
jgi:geranylgeranyl diphosphate synthase, type II